MEATHPLTRLTNWYLGHLQRNRREWVSAMICMFGFWDISFGHWNLLLLAIAVAGAKASRFPAVKTAAVSFVNWYLNAFEALRRRRLIRRGISGMIQRFPKNRIDLDQYLLARVTVADQKGRFLYDLKIVASSDPNSPDGDRGKISVGVLTVNFADIAKSGSELTMLPIGSDFRLRFRVGDIDPHAFRVGDKHVVIDLLSGKAQIDEYRVNIRYQAEEPEHIAQIRSAIETIAEEPIRAAARSVLAQAGNAGALRRQFGKLLHPDHSSSVSASAALASINAALDRAEA